jgi:hypothetical protein
MPIPAASGDGTTSSVLVALFLQLHDQVRSELDGLDFDSLNWVPTVGANSVSTIVTHLVGSEAETFRCVAGLKSERDRDAEFVGKECTIGELLAMLAEADDLIKVAEPLLSVARLEGVFSLPTLPADEVRSGMTWLVGNYGHAREHVGHIQLTKQLLQRRGAVLA